MYMLICFQSAYRFPNITLDKANTYKFPNKIRQLIRLLEEVAPEFPWSGWLGYTSQLMAIACLLVYFLQTYLPQVDEFMVFTLWI